MKGVENFGDKIIRTKFGLFRRRIDIRFNENCLCFYKRSSFINWTMKQYLSIPISNIIYFTDNPVIAKSKKLFIVKDETIITEDVIAEVTQNEKKNSKIGMFLKSIFTKKEEKIDREQYDIDMDMTISTVALRLKNLDIQSLCLFFNSVGAIKADVRTACGIIFKKYIAFTDKWLISVNKSDISYVPISEMAFFVCKKNLFSWSIYCGYHNQLQFKVVKTSLKNEIQNLCYKLSARLSRIKDATTYKAGLIFPEYLSISDDAIIYRRKTWFASEMSYIPLVRVDALLTSSNLLLKKIIIVGEQNVFMKNSFWIWTSKKIVNKILKYGIKTGSGNSFSSSWFASPWNWFGRGPKIICYSGNVVYFPNRLQNKTLKYVAVTYSNIEEVVWYKTFFSLFGTLVIEGSSSSIRTDQNSYGIEIVIPQLFAFKYKWLFITGKLKKILQAKTSASFSTERKKYSF